MQPPATQGFSPYLPIVGGIVVLIIFGYIVWNFLGLKQLVYPPSADANASYGDENTAILNTIISNGPIQPCASTAGSDSGSRSGSGSRIVSGFANPVPAPPPVRECLFFNLQPLAIKDTGFLGPYPEGKYNEAIATANALKAGFRFLTLQIDYLETKRDLSLYEAPGIPTLLIRDDTGAVLTGNSGSISTVAQTIASTAFNPIVPNYTEPIILYLHFVKTPSAVTSPTEYLNFLSKVAAALNPVAQFHLGLNSQGNFTRQKMAEDLLTMPMKYLEGQVIILSNVDTSMFRNVAIAGTRYPPAKDLDFLVNMRVFLESEDDAEIGGVTQLADQGEAPLAVLVNLSRVLELSSTKRDAFAAKGKRRYVIAMDPSYRTINPPLSAIDSALTDLGINAIPVDIFTETSDTITLLANQYSNMSYVSKPFALQYS
jgi:hypothetical protein